MGRTSGQQRSRPRRTTRSLAMSKLLTWSAVAGLLALGIGAVYVSTAGTGGASAATVGLPHPGRGAGHGDAQRGCHGHGRRGRVVQPRLRHGAATLVERYHERQRHDLDGRRDPRRRGRSRQRGSGARARGHQRPGVPESRAPGQPRARHAHRESGRDGTRERRQRRAPPACRRRVRGHRGAPQPHHRARPVPGRLGGVRQATGAHRAHQRA